LRSCPRQQAQTRRTVFVQEYLDPTDGSELNKAVKHGVLLAKENYARITAVIVTKPFHLVSITMSQMEYTRSEYKKHSDTVAEKALGVVADVAKCPNLNRLG
jgi:hypothetical protein